MTEPSPDEFPPIKELSRAQRRVLGVLVEKAFTTPEQYPLTLKATTTACNQKSNRDPLTDFDEPTTYDALDELRQMGLVGFVHTESGRTERYRHYIRHRFTFTEPQLAIMTELLLRGRQTLGELRGRASRMVPIDSLEQLRDELRGLQQLGYVQSNGPLERRGAEVDHNLYLPRESRQLEQLPDEPPEADERPAPSAAPATSRAAAPSPPPQRSAERSADWQTPLAQLRDDNRRLSESLSELQSDVRRLSDEVADLRRALGG
jgi:uncharacterized protein YceH (UPF0502 family)